MWKRRFDLWRLSRSGRLISLEQPEGCTWLSPPPSFQGLRYPGYCLLANTTYRGEKAELFVQEFLCELWATVFTRSYSVRASINTSMSSRSVFMLRTVCVNGCLHVSVETLCEKVEDGGEKNINLTFYRLTIGASCCSNFASYPHIFQCCCVGVLE